MHSRARRAGPVPVHQLEKSQAARHQSSQADSAFLEVLGCKGLQHAAWSRPRSGALLPAAIAPRPLPEPSYSTRDACTLLLNTLLFANHVPEWSCARARGGTNLMMS